MEDAARLPVNERSWPHGSNPCLYDCEPVDGPSTDHLDDEAVRRTLRRIRSGFSRLAQSDDATVLFRLGITAGRATDSP